MKKENLLNKRFGRLLVVDIANSIRGRSAWMCKCDCGNLKIIKSENLKNSSTKSCGCLNIEKIKDRYHKLYSSNRKYTPKQASARKVWKKRYNDGISFEDFLILSQMSCYYCGAFPSNIQNSAMTDKKASQFAKDNGDFIYNGLDRVDNSKPHLMDNCVSCCKWCNYAKRERTIEEFKLWVKALYNNLYGKIK